MNKRGVELREVLLSDIQYFFEYQQDSDANFMAAFTAKDPYDKPAFINHWMMILTNSDIIKKTIIYNGEVVENILNFEQFGNPEISYWISKQYWGKGIATKAVQKFLPLIKVRPLFARAVKDNLASIRVLEKCGFSICGEDKGFSNARGVEVEEYLFELEKDETRK
ncbi:N-acetyltransferase [Heyndrickxia sporothermodurans]|nr:N-acetyltransferase [Heyndrickxia sporothermodurans]